MIETIKISNFKSVVDLSLDLGNFNVLIGENGCGKSNILEAIAFGAAASADKLDYEFLGSRGIRVTNPEFMTSAFNSDKKKKIIKINFNRKKRQYDYNLVSDSENPKKWINKNTKIISAETDRFYNAFFIEKDEIKGKEVLDEIFERNVNPEPFFKSLKESPKNESEFKKLITEIFTIISYRNLHSQPDISNYIIYSPEQSSLRKFEETNQIYPLGIKGEGLFQYLKELASDKENSKLLNQIKENLALLDWYEDFNLPDNLMKSEFALNIKDRYINSNLQYFDQRSTNEGFLFLLFYSTLFISNLTPAFFAIDNIDTSFNPKLCMELTKNLASLAREHNKQVIITTHNPAILDGLDLKDDNQRLFVVRRNDEGHTIARRVAYKPERTMRLSEIWTNGFIGGLPENF
jgi:AAA15 family ATPase/GTPase